MTLNSKAKVLAKPQLYLNGNVCPFTIVESAKIEVMTVSEPRVTATQVLEGIKLEKNKEIVIEFEVGPKIVEAQILFKVELKNLDKKTVSLNSQYAVRFDSMRGQVILANQYLRRNQDGYYI